MIIVIQIIFFLFITSCTLKDFEKNNIVIFKERKKEFKKLIVPDGVIIPHENKEYRIPYTHKDLEMENYNIFPPI